jgi:hypothetical protein
MTIRPEKNSLFLIILALFFLLPGWTGAEAEPLRLLYSNDNMGELDACG